MFATTPAYAHSWYPAICCNGAETGGDCHPVPCDELVETKAGIEWHGIVFSGRKIRPTQDASCHVCTTAYTNAPNIGYCVFVLPSS